MSDSRVGESARAALAHLDAALAELAGLPLDSLSGIEVVGLWREVEARRRRLAPVDQALIAQVQQRGLAYELGYRSVVALAREVLRVSAGEAKARQVAAEALGPRRGLSGEALGPRFPVLAAAQAAGDVSAAAAAVIVHTLDALPDQVGADVVDGYEQALLTAAATLDVDQVRKLAGRVRDLEDPDGRYATECYRDRMRELWIRRRGDGSATLSGEANAELTEYLLTVLDATARPVPSEDGSRDPRSPAQRRHDGLLTALKAAMRAGQLPAAAGITTTVVLTMTDDTLTTGHGRVSTGHNSVVSGRTASSWIDGDARILPVTLSGPQGISALGSPCRLFTETQRLAMIARDRGCSFPGCDVAAQYCQAHHITPWSQGGKTHLDNGTLLCGYHHAHFERLGWQAVMIDRIPHWVPPPWTDPDQTPRRNTTNHPDLALATLRR